MTSKPDLNALPSTRDPRGRTLACGIALIALTLLVLGRTAGHEFVNLDDPWFISGNRNFLPPTGAGLLDEWRRPHAQLYIPATMTAWWLIAHLAVIGGNYGPASYSLNPWLFHLGSLLVHVANVLLVWRLLRRIMRDGDVVAAALGAAVFAVHPLQVETVAWASEMKDLLCAFFSLLSLLAMVDAMRSEQGRARVRYLYFAAGACYALALLSKPSAVVLPLVAAIVLWLIETPWRTCIAVLLVGLALATPIVIVTQRAQPTLDVPETSLASGPIVAADALAFYAGKLLWPSGLAVDYGRTPVRLLDSTAAKWTWIVPLALTIGVCMTRRRTLIAAGLIFVAAASANLGLMRFEFQVFSNVADHYVYFSFLGVAIAIASLARTRVAIGIIAACLFAVSVVSFLQAGTWRDSFALWERALVINPESGLAAGNLGNARLEAGDVGGALASLQRAVEIDPNDAFANVNLARARLVSGDTAGTAQSILNTVAAYRRRRDFNPELSAALLEKFADQINGRGDAASAQRLIDESRRLMPTTR